MAREPFVKKELGQANGRAVTCVCKDAHQQFAGSDFS
jgi:hypothetical protein